MTAAFLLEQQQQDYQLFECGLHWGGKLQTTHCDGFAFDHGFQVVQSAYPALDIFHRKGYLSDALAFGSGAWLLSNKGLCWPTPFGNFREASLRSATPASDSPMLFKWFDSEMSCSNNLPNSFSPPIQPVPFNTCKIKDSPNLSLKHSSVRSFPESF